jgi:hypothetical protein
MAVENLLPDGEVPISLKKTAEEEGLIVCSVEAAATIR